MNNALDYSVYLTLFLMASTTYLTRIFGYLVLRKRKLSPTMERVMEAVPGCVLISVITPTLVSGRLADTLAVGITLLAMCRFSLLPTVLISIASAGVLRAWLN